MRLLVVCPGADAVILYGMSADVIITIIFAGGVTLAAAGIGLLMMLRSGSHRARTNGD